MVSSGRQMAWSPLDLRPVLDAAFGGPPARAGVAAPPQDELVMRSLRAAGYAALLGLPLLLLASLMLEAPMAGPALIASGYLGIAFALQSNRPAPAAVLSGIVLFGLVAWLLICLASGAIPMAGPGLTAALLAPLFASAPSLARIVIASRAERASAAPPASVGARKIEDAASLPEAPRREPCEIARADLDAPACDRPARPSCDVGDAIRFALRHARPMADARRISLSVETEADLAAACDQQTCRRMVCALLERVAGHIAAGGSASLSARRVRGVVLLRVRSDSRPDANAASGQSLAAARAMIEAAGGTLVEHCARDGWSLSARLDLATVRMAMNPPTASTGAG